MLQEERHRYIIQQLQLNHKVLTTDLRKKLKVSLDTIRRDLYELEKSGTALKVHGGAISRSFQVPFQPQQVYAKELKKKIAEKALTLIEDGMTLLTGGGTIVLELAKIIPRKLNGTLFTVSPLVALEIAQRSSLKVILLGGHVSQDSYICTGSAVMSQLADIKVDLCLLGTNGLSPKAGVTDNDWEVAQVKKALVRASKKIALLCISEKSDTTQKMTVCELNKVNYLITELSPGDKKLAPYKKRVEII